MIRKIPVAILTASILALTGCHSHDSSMSHISDNETQKEMNVVNENIKEITARLPHYEKEVDNYGLKVRNLLFDWDKQVYKKYPTPSGWFDPFDHSAGKKQTLIAISVHNIFRDYHVLPPYTFVTKNSDVLGDFDNVAMVLQSTDDTRFLVNPDRGRNKLTILNDLSPFIEVTSNLLVSTQRILAFDYSGVELLWHPLVSQLWHVVYWTNYFAGQLKTSLLTIKDYVEQLKG